MAMAPPKYFPIFSPKREDADIEPISRTPLIRPAGRA
jgi:hypothetical protein